ncbi:unnamed protein product [Clonostachys solani]|uniref:Uncharacterized protein n=1 Tax=Clonostachys solani TaxID=160281 RepID=A0A9N9ZDI0_9HYPO|nr:unnamed protein product [Clonostachys solani]
MSGPTSDEENRELQAQPADVQAAALEPTTSHDPEPEDVVVSRVQSRKEDEDSGETPSNLTPSIGDEKGDGDAISSAPRINSDSDVEDEKPRGKLTATKSYATDATATSAGPEPAQQGKKGWRRIINPLRWGSIPPVPEERIISREYKASFLSKMVFAWMAPIMTAGYKRELDAKDIWSVNPDRAADPLTAKVKEAFKKHVDKGAKNPLFWALHDSFLGEFYVGAFFAIISSILQTLSPFVLRYLISFASEAWIATQTGRDGPPIGNGIGLAVGITVMQVLQSVSINHFVYNGMMVGGESRGVLIGLIYEKSMLISGRARAGDVQIKGAAEGTSPNADTAADSKKKKKKEDKKAKAKGTGEPDMTGWGNGRITNLMSVDTYRIDQASGLFHMVWTAPVSLIITIVLLIINISYNALAGLGLLVIGAPLLTRAIRSLFRRRREINKITDQRVSLTQEIIQSVKFVKFFGWEKAFLGHLQAYRNREISAIQVLLAIRNAINAVSMSLPVFASMLSFISYSYTRPDLPAAQVFSSLALFNGLRLPLNLIPLVLSQAIDAWGSMGRIQEFLLAEEMEEDIIHKDDGPNAVELHNAAFTWEKTPAKEKNDEKEKDTKKPKKENAKDVPQDPEPVKETSEREPFKIHDLDIEIGRNELVAVIGSVGSGKSSLLSALAGEMRKTSGEVVFGASRAFCPQYAWIQNATVQNNITFGRDFDKPWYKEVIHACALQADLDMLPNGDQTEIGERGITISGGQKQRINIARAIYFDADIVLMDDPLSAVDAHVGRHIFDHAILGLLKDKCRVLATHQLWVLNRCDRIVWMENGKIQAIDTFNNLMQNHQGFQTLMETTSVEKEKEEEKEGGDDEEGDNALTKKTTKKNKKGAALMQQEERAVASVPWSVYGDYVRASGSIFNGPFVIFLLILSQGSNITTSLWLSYWTSDKYGLSKGQYIGIYAGLGVVQALLMYLFSVMLSVLGTKSSKTMLQEAVTRVLRAPMSFFDTTPLGRITNRFSRDVDVMDNNLTDAIRMFFFTIAMVTAVFALIIAYFHYFAVALVPMYFLFMFSASYYRASAREVKRFESVLRSNVFAKFGEGLTGISSIRAYGLRERFITDLRKSIDEMNAAYYLTFSNQRWLSMRLDNIGNALIFTVGILIVTSRFSVDPSIGGLVLSYILSIAQMLQFSVRQLAEVENGMNAVERLRYYGRELEEEAPLHTVDVRPSWPEKGEIIFDKVEMRYRANLPLVLRGLSMHIQAGERIGIVGRTGAGKSSIMSTLFRLVEISAGSITVDGLNISTIGLQDLRSRLAIIPQDPTLFRGTIRSNLDPFSEHTDLELWSALRQADLVPADANTDEAAAADSSSSHLHLDTAVEEDGLNFSLGQRQLMALARALVRGSQIIVCDEATSSVDMETDVKIQTTMATGFKGKTLLCIAHRLRTIVGYDRICVMDAGQIAELDSPAELWKNEGGIFRSMCDRSGIRLEDIKGARETMEGIVKSDDAKVE